MNRSTVLAPRRMAALLAGALAAALAAGCASDSRPARSDTELLELRAAYLDRLAAESTAPTMALVGRLSREYDSFAQGATASPPTLDVLILSGGGDFGAFGAGFLVGWGRVPAGDMARPTFDAVTGVSTGALIAPFAFVGDDAAFEKVESLYRNPRPDWVRDRGILSFLLTESSYFDVAGLERDIRTAAGPELIGRIAEGAQEGRVLAVAATNIDYGIRRAFVLSQMALAPGAQSDPRPIQDAMLASAAIPIAFPAREVEGNLYVDGGLTSNLLFSGDPESPRGFAAAWRRIHPHLPLPRIRYWVIINNQLLPPPTTIQPRWSALGGATVETAIRASTAASARELNYLVRLQVAAGIDSQLHWISIPDSWRPPNRGLFTPETMRDLADLGRQVGSEPSRWMTTPPG